MIVDGLQRSSAAITICISASVYAQRIDEQLYSPLPQLRRLGSIAHKDEEEAEKWIAKRYKKYH